MMNQMKSRPEAVEAAINKVRANMTRSLIKMMNAPTEELRDVHQKRAHRSNLKLKALIALQGKMRAEELFRTVRDSQVMVACLANLDTAEDVYRLAVRAHVDLYTS